MNHKFIVVALIGLISPLVWGQASKPDLVLSSAQLAVARQVHLGVLPCELGVKVVLSTDSRTTGYFQLQLGPKQKYRMFPVLTSTGSLRLEDPQAGMVWLQLADKSMLLNQKLGKRVADVCQSPAQRLFAQHQATNPQPGLFAAPTPVQESSPKLSSAK